MWSIVKSHFHKGKTGFFITGLFIVLSVLMMTVGLSICFGIDTLYQKAKLLSNSADCYGCIYEAAGGESQAMLENLLKEKDYVEKYDVQDVYYLQKEDGENVDKRLEFYNAGGANMYCDSWVAYNVDDASNVFRPHIRDTVEKEGYKFYVTGNLVAASIMKVGDGARLVIGGKTYSGYIAGIYDDMTKIYDTANVYIDGELYKEIAKLSEGDGRITKEYNINIRIDCDNEKKSYALQRQLVEEMTEAMIQFNVDRLKENPFAPIIESRFNTREAFTNGTKSCILLLGTALVAF